MKEKTYIFSLNPIPLEELTKIPLGEGKVGNWSRGWILNYSNLPPNLPDLDFEKYSDYPYLYEIEVDDSLWTNRENCSKKKKKDCLDSTACSWTGEACQLPPQVERLPFEEFDQIIKPNKYYILANTKISLKDLKKLPLSEQSIVFVPEGWFFAKGEEWLNHFFYDVHLSRKEFLELGYTHLYEVRLNPKELISIRNEKEFERFNRDFEDWKRVKKEKSGFLLSQEEFNPDPIPKWYQPFLFPSGIIWSPKAVKNLELVYQN